MPSPKRRSTALSMTPAAVLRRKHWRVLPVSIVRLPPFGVISLTSSLLAMWKAITGNVLKRAFPVRASCRGRSFDRHLRCADSFLAINRSVETPSHRSGASGRAARLQLQTADETETT